jgi:uncharacterized protein YgfB (UPF0149 family)
MSIEQLPDFEQACGVSGSHLDSGELAECHGVACGLLCLRPGLDANGFLSALATLELTPDPQPQMRRTLVELHRAAAGQLADEQMRFALWLPADEEALEDRTEALSHWCTGFLAALGGAGDRLGNLPGEAAEALDDLRQIATATVSGDGDAEEEEAAFAELVEYVRIAVLTLREGLRPALDPGPGTGVC